MYILKMMWTAEIQILNEDMIVAVVIAIFLNFWGGLFAIAEIGITTIISSFLCTLYILLAS